MRLAIWRTGRNVHFTNVNPKSRIWKLIIELIILCFTFSLGIRITFDAS